MSVLKDKAVPTKAFTNGNVEVNDFCSYIGSYTFKKAGRDKRKFILNLGPVMLGTQSYYLGACTGERFIFLGLNGKVWRVTGKLLKNSVVLPTTTDKDAIRIWADTISQRIVDALSPKMSVAVSRKTSFRYNSMVKSLVQNRSDEASLLGFDRTISYYARHINQAWTYAELLHPRSPTLKHALYVSLILALPAKTAASLIEIGSLSEFRCPLINRDIALAVYQQAVQLLAKLCPEWWTNGAFTQWEYIGTIDEIFYKQYANLVINAHNKEIDLSTAAGFVRSDPLASYQRTVPEMEE